MLHSFKRTALTLFLLLASTTAVAAEAPLWTQFKQAKQAGTEPVLPDFSYAGYDYSETPIPDTSAWQIFRVTDFGAVASDGEYDDSAIQAAIDAEESAGQGVVLFPKGRFKVSPNEIVGENLFIRSSRIVLRGAGSGDGGTEIFMDKMKVKNGRHILEIRPNDLSETTLTEITADAQRESFEVRVADASKLSEGQRIIIRIDSVEYAKRYYGFSAANPIPTAWSDLATHGFRVRELHTIEAIDGNKIIFREPLHAPIWVSEDDSYQVKVRSYNMLNHIGIESIRFKGNWNSYPESFVHHKDDIHDYAWNAIRFDNVENSWVRDIEFKDWNQGLYMDGVAAVTIENVRFTGKKGHMSVHTRRSYGVLVKDSQDLAGHHHGVGVGYWGCGTVYLRYQMKHDQRMDSHSGSPYATLLDNISNGHFSGNGGPHDGYPHHGHHLVAWNFKVSGGPSQYDFWSTQKRNSHTFAQPYFVGLQGDSVSFTEGTYAANELPGEQVKPESLFEAQLALRLAMQDDNSEPNEENPPSGGSGSENQVPSQERSSSGGALSWWLLLILLTPYFVALLRKDNAA